MTYKKSKYFITKENRKIKYIFAKKNSQITVVFFHGFMSDMVGKKPNFIEKFCEKNKINFLKFEYSGHGKSKGKFIDGNISKWTNEAKQLIKSKIENNNNLIFIGSSMGSWIALNLFPNFKNQIKGFVGIASAPEFLENLMWKKFSKKIKKIILSKKIYYLKSGDYTYPITKQLILDGRKNKIYINKANSNVPIILFHGTKDEIVPLEYSKKIIKKFKNSKSKLVQIQNGNHSLSRLIDLKKICFELKFLIKLIN